MDVGIVKEAYDYEEPDPRLEYFDSILTRYETLREQLAQTPPDSAIEALGSDHPTSLGKLEYKVVRWWKWKMRSVNPLPAQVACMDKLTVLRLLGLITGGAYLKRGANVEIGVSQWVWSLLAKLPERGELNSEEIGVVRELGKKAVLVGMGLKEDQDWEEGIDHLEAVYEIGKGDDDKDVIGVVEQNSESFDSPQRLDTKPIGPQLPGGTLAETPASGKASLARTEDRISQEEPKLGQTAREEELAAAKARILASLGGNDAPNAALEPEVGPSKGKEPAEEAESAEDTVPTKEELAKKEAATWNTKATLDMIITIAGEMYGQRDLLEFRSVWADA